MDETIFKNHKHCVDHNSITNDHIDRITLKYKEDLVNFHSQSEGFARELERVSILFRELQTEFLVTLEEKRTNNE